MFQPSLFIEIKTKDKAINLGIIYRSPNSTDEEDDKVRAQLKCASQGLSNLIVAGDFNHPEIDWENSHTTVRESHKASKFLFLTNQYKFHQMINKPTHYKPKCRPSLIDLVLTKDPDLIDKIKLTAPLRKSYHSSIIIKQHPRKKTQKNAWLKSTILIKVTLPV